MELMETVFGIIGFVTTVWFVFYVGSRVIGSILKYSKERKSLLEECKKRGIKEYEHLTTKELRMVIDVDNTYSGVRDE